MSEIATPARRVPAFSMIAGAVAALGLVTPVILLSYPTMVAVGLSIVGAIRRERPQWLPYVVGSGAVLLLILAQSGIHGFGQIRPPPQASNAELFKDATWEYGSAKDDMRGTTEKWATLNSPTELDLAPPYEGPNVANVQVSSSGAIVLSVTKGQLICPFDHGTVAVKFDTGPVWYYPCSSPSNGESTVLYINSAYDAGDGQPTDPMDGLAKSKIMIVEVEFYDSGTRQVRFNVAGLDRTKL
ncbi:MAG TPA: phage holin family protein [Caulobacteraceae bacterium]